MSNNTPDLRLANALLNSHNVPDDLKQRADEIHEASISHQYVCREAVSLCGEPKDIAGLELISEASEWSGAAYRPQTIYWTQKLLDAAGDFLHIEERRRSIYHAGILLRLGKALEMEYRLTEALDAYTQANAIDPCFCYSVYVSGVLVKLGRFDEAVAVLQAAKCYCEAAYDRSYPILCDEDWYIENHNKYKQMQVDDELAMLDKRIEDVKAKQARGYKYKPRPKANAQAERQPFIPPEA